MFASKAQRIERSASETERLKRECLDWAKMRHDKDVNKQYQTQLNSLADLVERVCAAISRALPTPEDERNLAETFEHCRFLDQRTAWMRRLWEFFKEKFDQRDGPLGEVLRAADEVIWSCYRTPFKTLEGLGGPKPGASPLPYIESYLSPAAYPREIFPPGLTAEDKDFRRRFNQLPIPLVRISPLCLNEPWWLIYSAHESGHQVQYDLDLVEGFQLALEETAEAVADADTAALWGKWSREIFADIFSVGASGPPAALAMSDAEFGTSTHLLDRQLEGYPAPLVRLHLLDEAAQKFGFAPPLAQTLEQLKTGLGPLPPEIELDLKLVPLIVQAAFDKVQPFGLTLLELIPPYASYYQNGGKLGYWTPQLRYGPDPVVERNLESARLLSAAAYLAWNEELEEAQIISPAAEVRQTLAGRILQSLQQSREAGTRAASIPAEKTEVLDDLAQLLISPNTQLPPPLQI